MKANPPDLPRGEERPADEGDEVAPRPESKTVKYFKNSVASAPPVVYSTRHRIMEMRALLIASVLVMSLVGSTAFSDMDRIDIKDPARAVKSLALLYLDIGEGTISFFKDILITLDDVPKAILTDIFGGGQTKG